jgi:hypothetical protein
MKAMRSRATSRAQRLALSFLRTPSTAGQSAVIIARPAALPGPASGHPTPAARDHRHGFMKRCTGPARAHVLLERVKVAEAIDDYAERDGVAVTGKEAH